MQTQNQIDFQSFHGLKLEAIEKLVCFVYDKDFIDSVMRRNYFKSLCLYYLGQKRGKPHTKSYTCTLNKLCCMRRICDNNPILTDKIARSIFCGKSFYFLTFVKMCVLSFIFEISFGWFVCRFLSQISYSFGECVSPISMHEKIYIHSKFTLCERETTTNSLNLSF